MGGHAVSQGGDALRSAPESADATTPAAPGPAGCQAERSPMLNTDSLLEAWRRGLQPDPGPIEPAEPARPDGDPQG